MKIKSLFISILIVLSVLLIGTATFAEPQRGEDGNYNLQEVKDWNQSLIDQNPNRVDQVRISGTGTMYATDRETFTATVQMIAGGSSSGVNWSVSGPATIDQNGHLTPTGATGTAVITATAKDPSVSSSIVKCTDENGNIVENFLYYLTYRSATHSVSIKGDENFSSTPSPSQPAQPTTVTGISLNKSNLSFGHERDGSWYPASSTLTANLSPSGISGKTVNWYCNSDGVKLNPTGNTSCQVIPTNFINNNPYITITAECDNQVATCSVVLISRNNNDIKIMLGKATEEITTGGTCTLNAQVQTQSSTPVVLSWSSNNPGVAQVDNNGNVKGISPGQATITATASTSTASGMAIAQATNSASATCLVTVTAPAVQNIPVTEVTLTPATATLEIGQQIEAVETITPANATDRAITWGSSDSDVAIVDASGFVTAEGSGQAIITASAHNGVKGQMIVQVKKSDLVAAPTKVNLSVSNKILNIGEEVIIAAHVEPAGTVQAVDWKSSNPDVAKVEQGRVIAHKEGTATITATTPTGISDTCTITVNKPAAAVKNVSGVSLDTSTKTLKEGDSFILNENVSPADATNKAVKWESSNPSAATVSAGKVTAVTKGTAQIKVTTDDGNKTATCTVTVEAVDKSKHINVSNITLDKTSANIQVGDSLPLDQTITPSDASDKAVKWFSTNDQVAKVSNQGIVVGVGPGEATISVVTEDGMKTAECKVTVKAIAEDKEHQTQNTPGIVQPGPIQSPSDPGTTEPEQPSNPTQPSEPTQPSDPGQTEQPNITEASIYRLFNPITGEHIYTTNANEALTLANDHGWKSEGAGWESPSTGTPVYRLYNAGIDDHLYTTDENEVKVLTNGGGWTADNNGQPIFYSGGDVPIYRLYNPGTKRHHLTKDANEYNILAGNGWQQEGEKLSAVA